MPPKVPSAKDLSPGWQRKRAATTERILQTAFAILEEDGMRGLTIPRLSKELGYTVGALYRYFPSKDALVAAVQGRAAAQVGGLLEDAGARVAEALSQKRVDAVVAGLVPLVTFSEMYSRLPELMPEVLTTVTEALRSPQSVIGPEANEQVMHQLVPILDMMSGWLADAARAGAIQKGPDRERALILWGTLHGSLLVLNANLPTDWKHTSDLANSAIRATLVGWGAESAKFTKAQRVVRDALAS